MTTSKPADGRPAPSTPTNDAPTNDPEALRAQVARTREELGDTVQALATKADMRRQTVQQAGDAVRERRGPIVAVAAVLAAGWLLRWVRGRRRRKQT